MMSSWTSVAVWMNSTTDAYSTARSPRVARHARRHQQHRRADPLAAAVLDVVADRRDERDLRLDVPGELALDLAKVVANRLEHLREGGGGGFLRGGIQAGPSDHSRARSVNAASALIRVRSCSYGLKRRRKFASAAPPIASPCRPAQRGDRLGDAHDVRRLVALAAVRHRREKRAVGLDQQPIERARSAPPRCSSSARGNVTMPASEMWKPTSSARRAMARSPVKQ